MATDASAVRPSEQRTVGDYVLTRRLGSGAMGEVWLARHRVTETFAAVKMLRENVKSRDRIAKTFEVERRAIGRLNHPHIVSLFDVGPHWLATAYVEGTDLARRLKTPIDPASAVHVVLQVASALAHAHAHGVVHRDVKPSNILIDTAGNAYLADFGLAQLSDDLDRAGDNQVGTLAFMAPEQMRGEVATPQADQYALARTLIEMLAGGTPQMAPHEALAEVPAELPAQLRGAIARATSATPEQRFPSVSEFAAALASCDLRAYPPPRRLAPELRVRTPYRWTAGASLAVMLAPDIQRANYRLSDLVTKGLLPAAAVEQFQQRTGYADVGWSVWGNTGRLGAITDPSSFARVTEVAVLVHGMFCTRAVFAPKAPALCRDNAQSVVLALDVGGFGESRFHEAPPDREHCSPKGLVRMVLEWMSLLGIRDLPSVIVGHSMAAAALLTMTDAEMGERVSRVAITPVFPAYDERYRKGLKMGSKLLPAIGGNGLFRKLFARSVAATMPHYTKSERDLVVAQVEKANPKVLGRIMAEYGVSSPSRGDDLQRCIVLIADDDPVARASILEPALEKMGFPRTHVRKLVDTGGHMSYAEQQDYPEHTQRTLADIVACVSSMLRSSSEGAPLGTEVASTMVGSDEPSDPSSGSARRPSTDPAAFLRTQLGSSTEPKD